MKMYSAECKSGMWSEHASRLREGLDSQKCFDHTLCWWKVLTQEQACLGIRSYSGETQTAQQSDTTSANCLPNTTLMPLIWEIG